ncbi:MAG: sigma-70 family RNA polymerase sigma factor [Xanthomonadales bacterium]|nr:sigma-70 family RNA polymerase sigma factor [Xanthomonadales bacterium]MCC6560201.1 sigma-70 family RNA polymerase sigma factor [Xanthomonadales bacterium]
MIAPRIAERLAARKNAALLRCLRESPMSDARPETVSSRPGIDDAFHRLYAELKRLARAQRRRRGDTLNTTGLVHDLYLSLAARDDLDLREPVRFYAYAAKAMRHLLVDRARARARLKSGGDQILVELPHDDETLLAGWLDTPERAFELDSAINALEREDARAADVVELYLFGGLTLERIATMHGLSTRTVDRDWRFARAYLQQALAP